MCLDDHYQLQQSGIFKSEELITRFFRISVEMCVDLCYRTLNDPVSYVQPLLWRGCGVFVYWYGILEGMCHAFQ